MRWHLLPLMFLLACGAHDDDLCTRFYSPYPNHIGERPRTALNAALLDAMAAYDKGDFTTAAAGLSGVIEKDAGDRLARLYLASALLGSGEPYKAEMHLDFLERVPGATFKDQTQWFNTLCWLCSGQQARALAEAERIAGQPAHTYKAEARALADALQGK
jgi:hypothetical protein